MIESGANRHEDAELPQAATSFPRVVSMRRAGAFAICLTLLAAGKTSDVTLEMPEKGGVPAAPKNADPVRNTAPERVNTSIDTGAIQVLLQEFMRDRRIMELPVMSDDINILGWVIYDHLQAQNTPLASFDGVMIADGLTRSGMKKNMIEQNEEWVKKMHDHDMPVADSGSTWSGIEIHAFLDISEHPKRQIRFKVRPIIELPEGAPERPRHVSGPWLVTAKPQNIDEYAPLKDEWETLLSMLRATGTEEKRGADFLFDVYSQKLSIRNWHAEQPAAHE